MRGPGIGTICCLTFSPPAASRNMWISSFRMALMLPDQEVCIPAVHSKKSVSLRILYFLIHRVCSLGRHGIKAFTLSFVSLFLFLSHRESTPIVNVRHGLSHVLCRLDVVDLCVCTVVIFSVILYSYETRTGGYSNRRAPFLCTMKLLVTLQGDGFLCGILIEITQSVV